MSRYLESDIMTLIREHDLGDILDRLLQFSKGRGSGTRYGYYVLCGQEFVPVRKFHRLARRMAGLLRRGRRPGACVKLPLRAEVIRVKNNLRLFGYGPGRSQTVKIALAGIMRDGSLRREIRARNFIQSLNCDLSVPAILDYDSRHAGWLIERQIDTSPSKSNQNEKADIFIKFHALPFYAATARLREIKPYTAEDLRALLPENVMTGALENMKWPVAFGHGDLSPGNMMSGARDDKLYIVDWEKAGVMPVACDLRKLYKIYPAARPELLRILATLSGDEATAAPAKLQMALALAIEAAEIKNDRQRRLDYAMNVHDVGKEQATRMIDESLSSNHQLIRELLE